MKDWIECKSHAQTGDDKILIRKAAIVAIREQSDGCSVFVGGLAVPDGVLITASFDEVCKLVLPQLGRPKKETK